jgi:hypothetical protein
LSPTVSSYSVTSVARRRTSDLSRLRRAFRTPAAPRRDARPMPLDECPCELGEAFLADVAGIVRNETVDVGKVGAMAAAVCAENQALGDDTCHRDDRARVRGIMVRAGLALSMPRPRGTTPVRPSRRRSPLHPARWRPGPRARRERGRLSRDQLRGWTRRVGRSVPSPERNVSEQKCERVSHGWPL